jgi:hypothetical protein
VFLFGDLIYLIVVAGFVLHGFDCLSGAVFFGVGCSVRTIQAHDFSLLKHRILAVISFFCSTFGSLRDQFFAFVR